MGNNDWQYYGVFLEEQSKRNLLMFVKRFVHVPRDWKKYCDHMTIIYNDLSERAYVWGQNVESYIGQKVRLRITHIGVSEKSIAVKVTGYASSNKIPHVTVAVAPGAKPVDSNYITDWHEINDGLTLVGEVNVVNRKRFSPTAAGAKIE